MLILATAFFKYHRCRPPFVTSQLLLALQLQPEQNSPWGELALGRAPLEKDSHKCMLHYSLKHLVYIHLNHRLFSRPLQMKLARGEPIQSLSGWLPEQQKAGP